MPNGPVPAAGEAVSATFDTMTTLAIALLLFAAALWTRLFRIWLARLLLRISNRAADLGERFLLSVRREERP